MGLDIRVPIGLMFSLIGPILLFAGITLSFPLDTRTGGAMLAFGAFMLITGIAAQRRASSPK